MSEIRRGGVPWKKTAQQRGPTPEQIQKRAETRRAKVAARLEERGPLVAADAVAFRGNVMTGEALDSRGDYPPQGYNPPPKKILANKARRRMIARRFARPPQPAKHESASDLSMLRSRDSRQVASMQRKLFTSKETRIRFERQTGLTVVRDGRLDGTLSVIERDQAQASSTRGVGVATGAMTQSSGPSTMQDFYGLLAQMEQAVLGQASAVWAAQNQTGAPGNGTGTFLGMPLGPAFDLMGGQSPSSLLTSAVGGMTANEVASAADDGGQGSVDINVQKVALAVQRMAQIYQAIGNVFSKYHESANQAINNAKA